MTCDSTRLLGHVLEAPDPLVEAHVKRCAPCAHDAGALRRLDDELQQVYRYRSIMSAIRARPETPRRKIYGPLVALGLAGAAALLLLIAFPTSDREVEQYLMRAGKLHIEAQKLVDEKKYDEALQTYDQILAMSARLSAQSKDELAQPMIVYKAERRRVTDLKKSAGAQLAKVSKWIEDAEDIRDNFSLDRAAPFLYKSDWICKIDHAKAAALYKELEAMRDAASAAVKSWAREQSQFDTLMAARNYPAARTFVNGFLLATHDQADKEKAQRAGETIVPYAKEHVGRVKSAIVKKKEGAKIEDLKKEWDEAVEKHFKGILPQEDLDKAWDDILRK